MGGNWVRGAALIAAAVVAVNGSAADAAKVTVANGSVSVNVGSGWVPLSAAADFGPSTKVMVSKDSEALIAYADGCVDRVKPGMVKVISITSPCVGRSNATEPVVATPALEITPLAVAAAAAAVAITVVVVTNSNDNEKPASP